MSENVLVVAVHPDDETLGCGGTILKHRAQGDRVWWVVVTSIPPGGAWSDEQRETRAREIQDVARKYGFEGVIELGFPAMGLEMIPLAQLIDEAAKYIRQVKPSIVYLPYLFDAHSDHRVCCHAFSICLKNFRFPSIKKVLMMEVPSETDHALPGSAAFSPNFFVGINDFIEDKLKILGVYSSEIAPPPFPRSLENIRALAVNRGASCGCLYAEAFMLVKETWR